MPKLVNSVANTAISSEGRRAVEPPSRMTACWTNRWATRVARPFSHFMPAGTLLRLEFVPARAKRESVRANCVARCGPRSRAAGRILTPFPEPSQMHEYSPRWVEEMYTRGQP